MAALVARRSRAIVGSDTAGYMSTSSPCLTVRTEREVRETKTARYEKSKIKIKESINAS